MLPEGMSEADKSAVQEQLALIFKSKSFLQSRRRQRFLQYIVNETLAGRGERLKGYNIAVEVFDRAATFDSNIDPIVRMEAGRLRDKLREYYETDGRNDVIRIDLPKGAYTPHIDFRQSSPSEPLSLKSEPLPRETIIENSDPLHVGTEAKPSDTRIPTAPFKQDLFSPWHLAIAVSALLAALSVSAWHYRSVRQPAPGIVGPTSMSDAQRGPAIGVLPFLNLSGDAKQDYFSDGLTEDILTELSKAKDFRVLARNTTFQYKGKAMDVAQLGRDLKVRYVLEGSIQRAADRLRVTAQLIDTDTGTHVWADRYDRDMADLFIVQDDIVNQIVGKIAGSYGVIETVEARSAARKSPNEIQAYDLVLRAREAMQWQWTSDTFREARALLNQAIALDPSNAQARRQLAWIAVMGWVFRLDATPVPPEEILDQAARSVELDPADARTHMVAASAYFFTKQLDLFRREADQALALAPFDAEILAALACMISSSGDHQRGVALAKKANTLNADAAAGWYHSTVYTAEYLSGDYERALDVAKQNHQAEMFYSHMEIIPILGQLGRKQEALEAWQKLLTEYPGVTASDFENWWRLWNIHEEEVAQLMDGVYKSGVLSTSAKPNP